MRTREAARSWRTRSEARLVHYRLLLRRLNLEIFKNTRINLKVKFVHFQNLERGWTELTRGEQGNLCERETEEWGHWRGRIQQFLED